MIKSQFLDSFKRMAEEGADQYDLIGNFMLVEEVDPESLKAVTRSGLVLQGDDRNHDGFNQNRPVLVHVLAVGAGYMDDEGKTVPLDSKPGDVVLIGPMSVKWLSTLGGIISTNGARIGITSENEVQMRFKGAEAYNSIQVILANTSNKGGQ